VKAQKFLLSLATFFGVGKIPKAPGTWGSLAALPFAALMMLVGPFFYMGLCLALTPLSIFAAETYEQVHGGHDSSEIVIDEVLGMWIAIIWLPMTWQTFLIGFLLFRFFDVLKPWPISYLDRHVKGGVGVVVDDVLAGLIVNIILQIIYQKTAWLGLQLIGGLT